MEQRKLLLADDSITIQKVVNLTFADEGIEVITANDGNAAMEKLGEISPDLVMADVNMPGLSGYEICERIKQNQQTRQTPVILLVGSFEPFDEERARQVGADDFLTKPFQSIRQLVSKVSDLLQSSEKKTPAPDFQDTLEMEPPRPQSLQTDEAGIDDEMIQTEQVGAQEEQETPVYGQEADLEQDSAQRQHLNQYDGKEFSFAAGENQRGAETASETLSDESQYTQPESPAEITEPEIQSSRPTAETVPVFDFDDMNLLEIPPLYTDEPAETKEAIQAEEISEPSAATQTDLPSVDEIKESDQTDWQPTQTYEAGSERTEELQSAPEETLQSETASEDRQARAEVGSQFAAFNFPPEVIDAIAEKVVEKLSARLKE
ncbi:MAG TPA: response regulator [Pyrinomonadaceae bacterium]|nr:response regulator [Pyrinomonadaceae bacterium]